MVLNIPGMENIFTHSRNYDQGLGTRGIRKGAATFVVALDGSGDFDDIQEAIDALGSEGGKITIKEGTYNLTDTIILKDNITLSGMGFGTIIDIDTGSDDSTAAVDIEKKDNVKIEEMVIKIKGNGVNNDDRNHYILVGNNVDLEIRNVRIETDLTMTGTAASVISAYILDLEETGVEMKELNFDKLEIKETAGDSFNEAIVGGRNADLKDSRFRRCEIDSNMIFINLTNAYDTKWVYCTGRFQESFLDEETTRCVWMNCDIDTLGIGGTKNRIIGNHLDFSDIYLDTNCSDTAVVGNLINGIISNNGTNNSITGNVTY